ncbi:MAG: chorismate synthase, partial [Thermoguttaceae bacterium]|nr:chorismate synthase [Thermoguttaceae bacterium]
AAMKPIPTLRKPLRSVDLDTKEAVEASFERSDACAVSAASVVLENVVAFEIAAAVVEKFGGDSLDEIKERLELFEKDAAKRLGS